MQLVRERAFQQLSKICGMRQPVSWAKSDFIGKALSSIGPQDRPLSVGSGDLVAKPGIEPIRCLRVIRNDVDAVSSIPVVDETVNSLLKEHSRAAEEPAELCLTQPVHGGTDRVQTAKLGDFLGIPLRERRRQPRCPSGNQRLPRNPTSNCQYEDHCCRHEPQWLDPVTACAGCVYLRI